MQNIVEKLRNTNESKHKVLLQNVAHYNEMVLNAMAGESIRYQIKSGVVSDLIVLFGAESICDIAKLKGDHIDVGYLDMCIKKYDWAN